MLRSLVGSEMCIRDSHKGDLENPEKPAKTEVLFVSVREMSYRNATTFDNTDLSEINIVGNRFFPVVEKFCYLGTMITRDCKDNEDVCCRIKKAGNAFGALRRIPFPR